MLTLWFKPLELPALAATVPISAPYGVLSVQRSKLKQAKRLQGHWEDARQSNRSNNSNL